jgi:hypothetical protein
MVEKAKAGPALRSGTGMRREAIRGALESYKVSEFTV